ncbi:MAG: GTPase domain-containing protein [Sedimenticola sp.]
MSLFNGFSDSIIPGAIGALFSLVVTFYFSLVARRKLPVAHNVAVIGYPRSGKTTLITALFSEIFSRKIQSISITPRGEETISKVNDDIARLESGKELGATTDQDLFAYRAEMITGKGLFSKRYKIEIGDFPGEDSEELSSKDAQWLHKLPYFKWVLNADAFIFVIDSEKLINENKSIEYVAQLTSSFRAAWQKLKDHHYDGIRELRNKPIVLVFSKCDLFDFEIGNDINSRIQAEKEKSSLSGIEDRLTKEFGDLIQYFKYESSKFNLVFSSSLKKDPKTSIRIGANEVLKGVLPK